jgi:transcriptional regulator with XRE-family HTH domain
MARSKGKTTDASEILRRRFVAGDPEMAALVQQERDNLDVAQQIHDLRTAAGLTQQQLAERVGTTASVICRLEDADYTGHSLTLLRRVAAALGSRIEVRFVAEKAASPRTAAHGLERGRVVTRRQPGKQKADSATRPAAR